MVKGISKRVVVVKAPVGSIFDEAIFIMRDDLSSNVDSEKILREACCAVDEYVKQNCAPKKAAFKKMSLFLMLFTFIIVISALLFFFLPN